MHKADDMDGRKVQLHANAEAQLEQPLGDMATGGYVDFYAFAPVGCLTLNDHGQIAEINLAGAEMLGLARAKLLRHPFGSSVVGADGARWQQHFITAMQRDAKLTCEVALQRPDQSRIDVRLDSMRLARDGEPPLLRVVLIDITERKNSQIALRDALHFQETILNAVPHAIIVVTSAGMISHFSRGAEHMLGYTAEEIVGHHSVTVLHDAQELAARASEFDRQMAVKPDTDVETLPYTTRRGDVNAHEWTLVRKDASRFPALISSVALLDEDGATSGVLFIAMNISERTQSEQQRLGRERQQRDTLVREVHHRIKNHLQGLAGLVRQNARRHPALAAMADDMVSQISAIATVHGLQGGNHGGSICLPRILADIANFLGRSGQVIFTDESTPDACGLTLNDEDAVPVALIVNELITNALRHGDTAAGQPVRVVLECIDSRSLIIVRNSGKLPPDFDFAAGAGLGAGLELVGSLLPTQGASLEIAVTMDGMVECRLVLTPPVVAGQATTGNDSKTESVTATSD